MFWGFQLDDVVLRWLHLISQPVQAPNLVIVDLLGPGIPPVEFVLECGQGRRWVDVVGFGVGIRLVQDLVDPNVTRRLGSLLEKNWTGSVLEGPGGVVHPTVGHVPAHHPLEKYPVEDFVSSLADTQRAAARVGALVGRRLDLQAQPTEALRPLVHEPGGVVGPDMRAIQPEGGQEVVLAVRVLVAQPNSDPVGRHAKIVQRDLLIYRQDVEKIELEEAPGETLGHNLHLAEELKGLHRSLETRHLFRAHRQFRENDAIDPLGDVFVLAGAPGRIPCQTGDLVVDPVHAARQPSGLVRLGRRPIGVARGDRVVVGPRAGRQVILDGVADHLHRG